MKIECSVCHKLFDADDVVVEEKLEKYYAGGSLNSSFVGRNITHKYTCLKCWEQERELAKELAKKTEDQKHTDEESMKLVKLEIENFKKENSPWFIAGAIIVWIIIFIVIIIGIGS